MKSPSPTHNPGFVVLRQTDEQGLPEYLHASNPCETVVATTLQEVLPALMRVEAAATSGLTAIGFIAYEAGPAFDPCIKTHPPLVGLPLVWFGLYEQVHTSPNPPRAYGEEPCLDWQPQLDAPRFAQRFERVREYIASGDVYQVNFTFPLHAPFAGDAYALFRKVAVASEPLHGAFLDLGRFAVASFSPESFLELDGDSATSRPMKGSASRGRWREEDVTLAAALSDSQKDRAENLMIVDMVRNDLSRIARTGTVRTGPLFSIEPHPTVHQMTSTVTAETDRSVADVLAAMFPPASITGAPKSRATAIIHELEDGPRGVYTGCIGSIGPGRRASLNVAIRTVLVDRDSESALYPVGSGIVWDSTGPGEYDECLLKAEILRQDTQPFALLETLRWSPPGMAPSWTDPGYALLDRHLERIAGSAATFGFPCDVRTVQEALDGAAQKFLDTPMRVRLRLFRRGRVVVDAQPLPAPCEAPVRLAFAREPVDVRSPFLFHKTTRRGLYEQAAAGRPDADDVVLWNAGGEVCETTIANIAVQIEGRWWTPPIACGLLPGTLRAELLATGELEERVIGRDEALASQGVVVFNSVRGWCPAIWI